MTSMLADPNSRDRLDDLVELDPFWYALEPVLVSIWLSTQRLARVLVWLRAEHIMARRPAWCIIGVASTSTKQSSCWRCGTRAVETRIQAPMHTQKVQFDQIIQADLAKIGITASIEVWRQLRSRRSMPRQSFRSLNLVFGYSDADRLAFTAPPSGRS